MVREYVRWDYELRDARQVDAVVDRALAMATAEPAGPVYLSLPRELLAGPASEQQGSDEPSRLDVGALSMADPEVVDLVAGASSPLIIANSAGSDVAALSSQAGAQFLLMAGEPIGEAIEMGGSFVMNSRRLIETAYVDFRAGRMGKVSLSC